MLVVKGRIKVDARFLARIRLEEDERQKVFKLM
jgi:hypothetical protein